MQLPFSEFKKQYKHFPREPQTWDEYLYSMLRDRTDAIVVEELREEFERDGQFRKPIIVSDADDVVVDGYHRLVVFHQISKESGGNPIVTVEMDSLFGDDVEINFTATPNDTYETRADGSDFSEDPEGFALDGIRSMRVNGEWVEVYGSVCDGVITAPLEDTALILGWIEAAKLRLGKLGFDVTVVGITIKGEPGELDNGVAG